MLIKTLIPCCLALLIGFCLAISADVSIYDSCLSLSVDFKMKKLVLIPNL